MISAMKTIHVTEAAHAAEIVIRISLLLTLLGVVILSFSPVVDANAIDGRIIEVSWPQKSTYGYFESVPIQVNFTNIGSETYPFWLVYFVQDPSGSTWSVQESIYTARQTPPLQPGGNSSAKIQWCPQDAAPEGIYTAVVVLCKNYENGHINGELDRKTKGNAFQLKKSPVLSQKLPTQLCQCPTA